MPIADYSVLAGVPVAGKVATGASMHYQITMNALGKPFYGDGEYSVGGSVEIL